MRTARLAMILTTAALSVAAEAQTGPARVLFDINRVGGEKTLDAPPRLA